MAVMLIQRLLPHKHRQLMERILEQRRVATGLSRKMASPTRTRARRRMATVRQRGTARVRVTATRRRKTVRRWWASHKLHWPLLPARHRVLRS